MPAPKIPPYPTHVGHTNTGETFEYWGPPYGAHPTHWSVGGEETVDADGNKHRAPGSVRVLPVTHHVEVRHHLDDDPNAEWWDEHE